MFIFAAEINTFYTMFSRRFLRIKVVKALYAHQTGAADTVAIEEKELLKGLDKDYDLYHYVLSLISEVKRYAEERIELARNKHLPTAEDLNPNLKFVTNEVVARIEADAELDHILAIRKLGWAAYPELIKHLYVKMGGLWRSSTSRPCRMMRCCAASSKRIASLGAMPLTLC